MGRTPQSQWDFGELFSPEQTRRVHTVGELTTTIRRLLEKQVGTVWVTGEITNFRAQASGHLYFSLKDAAAQIQCVCFRGDAAASRSLIADGRKVVLQGEVTVYEPRGQYQLIVRQVELQGIGALQKAFEELKRRLAAEGLFAAERKRPVPRLLRRLGIATSPTGAALQDVLHVIRRRQPALEIVVAPCRVQGAGAAAEIAAAVALLNEFSSAETAAGRPPLDAILVTRGGGSLEDLWAFNEETTARAIAASRLPVVSAVGHEIDFTISDFVADLRAATPSAAAELLTATAVAVLETTAVALVRLQRAAHRQVDQATEQLADWRRRLARAHPRRRLNDQLQWLDELQSRLLRAARRRWRDQASLGNQLAGRLHRLRPAGAVAEQQERLAALIRRWRTARVADRDRRQRALDALLTRLRLLGPQNVLARGYSITRDAATGRVITGPADLAADQELRTTLRDGEVRTRVVKGSTDRTP